MIFQNFCNADFDGAPSKLPQSEKKTHTHTHTHKQKNGKKETVHSWPTLIMNDFDIL